MVSITGDYVKQNCIAASSLSVYEFLYLKINMNFLIHFIFDV